MDRIFRALKRRRPSQSYEPLEGGSVSEDGTSLAPWPKTRFSWLEYYIFLLLGISMLWAWNMFLAAAPYFQARFSSSDWILTHFQSAIISVSTVTNLGSMILLTKLQKKASYPKRIIASLILNLICFTLLALSTTFFRHVSADGYFAFLMIMVFAASLATGLCQNGVFAYVAGFGVGEYTQAIMTGQAVAGVLPCIAQIVSVLSVPARDSKEGAGQESPKSAFAYFLTATGVSALALLAFLYLSRQHPDSSAAKRIVQSPEAADQESPLTERKVVGMRTLFKKLQWLATAVFLCFAITMLFPVFTQEILSVRKRSLNSDTAPSSSFSRLFQPACFIPLAFLLWNAGDLTGRLLTLISKLSLVHYPRTVFLLSLLRVVFIPLYLLCNIRGRGAIVNSDVFYLFVVQFLFGLSNGYLGSTCMMGASKWVEVEEREAAGGFMGLMLVGGLTVGSLLSFGAARA
ncbi:hypothetical protein MMC24_000727 [Lignoscripta atroalba]|nr:hypothetical protein [Lignoscripta atroalba]